MSISGSAGLMQGGQSSASFTLNLTSQKKVEEKSETGEAESRKVVLTGLEKTFSSDYSGASKGELLQDALLANSPSKQKNMISGLFVSLLPETSRYLQAQLDGLKMQNEFANQLNGVLESAIMNTRAGKSSAFIARTIEESIEQIGDKKIHEDAEEDFEEAEEELEEKIEENINEEGETDLAATEGAEAVRKDIEQRAEEVTQSESQSEQEGAADAPSVQDAIDEEAEHSAGENSAVTETSLQAADGVASENGQTVEGTPIPSAGTYLNVIV